MSKPFLFLFIAFFSFSFSAFAQVQKLYCSHPEICTLLQVIAKEQETIIETESIVSISGDPHGFEPSIAEIKKLMSASFLVEGPYELNPWIKKVNVQRVKNAALKTSVLTLTDRHVKQYLPSSKEHKKESIAHFWLYPKIYCDFKSELTQQLSNAKIISIKKKTDEECLKKAEQQEKQLNITLSQVDYPIILTHDALWPLLNSLKGTSTSIVAIKGSGHHEEASTSSVKKLYDALKAPKAIWIEEKGIHVPSSILNKKRASDLVIKIDTARSEGPGLFPTITKLNDELSKLQGKK